MNEADVAAVLRDALLVTLKLAGPPLAAGLVVGALVSLLQAVTQIQEATLAFVPKAVALGVTLAFAAPFMFAVLSGYTHELMDRIVAIGGS
jgi:flagellar biosynthetic protein FliQ